MKAKNMIEFNKLPKYGSEEWFSIEDFSGEVWKPVPDYEDIYSVSCYGRVKSRILIKNKRKGLPYIKEKIVATPLGKNGYQHVTIYRNGIRKIQSLHRLVALVFGIERACEGGIINHKDENRMNNCVSNLEWCSHQYNALYGTAQKRHVDTREKHGLLKAVIAIDKSGNETRYKSIHEAAKDLGSCPNNVWACCVGRYKTCKGRRCYYESDYKQNIAV